MAKYLNADELERWVRGLTWTQTYKYPILAAMKEVGSVDVVRCKECRNSRPLNREDWLEDKFVEGCVWCYDLLDGVDENWFCAKGERKDDAQNV